MAHEWQTVQKSAYLADFIDLSKDIQQAVVRAVADLEQDPMRPRGNTIKKMTGYKNVWRYRLGDFRLIYAVAPEVHMIRLLAIGPRASVYQRFDFPGWDAPNTAVEFGPELAKQIDWEEKYQEWSQPEPPIRNRIELPRRLTPGLLTKWQIEAAYHSILMRCIYEEELLNLPEKEVPPAVLGRVMDCLYPAPVDKIAGQPDHVLLDPEDLLRYAEGDLAGFLLRLDEQQQPFIDWAMRGPTLVKGGPGSGKSTVALYRIRAIVEQSLIETGEVPSILFTTYTNALINSTESLLHQLLRDLLNLGPKDPLPRQIRVTTLHKTASWITQAGGIKLDIANAAACQTALSHARQQLTPKALGDQQKLKWLGLLANLRDDYLLDEFEWVLEGQNCQTIEDYFQANRVGRGIPFNRALREAVWHLYQQYLEELDSRDIITFGQMVRLALHQVAAKQFSHQWEYVIIDEAQDLTPTAIQLCVQLCTNPQGVFLTADANQSLYNRGFRWSQVHEGLRVTGRTRVLKRNYRSTKEIALAAAQIMVSSSEYDQEAAEQIFVHSGVPPVMHGAVGSADQAQWIAQQVYQAAKDLRLPLNAAVILVSSSVVGKPLAQALSNLGFAGQVYE